MGAHSGLTLRPLSPMLSVCKLPPDAKVTLAPLCFAARTEDELSWVCPTEDAPSSTLARSDGWRAFRVAGTLDFSLVGILADIAQTLAERGISLFAVSTYDTDYVLTKAERFADALDALTKAGYRVDEA